MNVSLAGPTYFAHVIQHGIEIAKNN